LHNNSVVLQVVLFFQFFACGENNGQIENSSGKFSAEAQAAFAASSKGT
jgi:hypothetical protein